MKNVDPTVPGLQYFSMPTLPRTMLVQVATLAGAKAADMFLYGSQVYGPLVGRQAADFDFMVSTRKASANVDKLARALKYGGRNGFKLRAAVDGYDGYDDYGHYAHRTLRMTQGRNNIDLTFVDGDLDHARAASFSNIALAAPVASLTQIFIPEDSVADMANKTLTLRADTPQAKVPSVVRRIQKMQAGHYKDYTPQPAALFADRPKQVALLAALARL